MLIREGPRSRASLAALPCHSSFQAPLGATYNFQLCDSVPDLSSGNSGFNESNSMLSLSSSSAPRKIPINSGAFRSISAVNNNNCIMNDYGTPLRTQNHNKKPTKTPPTAEVDDDNVVQLRRRNVFMSNTYENNFNDKQNEWMYRRPNAPNDIRHSRKLYNNATGE